jgi:hypothetical protein
MAVPARFERATSAFEARRSAPLSYGTICIAGERAWYAQEDSNLQPRSGPELTTGISRPLCQLSYGRAFTLALRREIESLSPVRQTGRLTRGVTEQG